MDRAERKKRIDAYKETPTVGGVYKIVNTITGEVVVTKSSVNLHGEKSKLDFAKTTNLCWDNEFSAQWRQYGAQAFEFVLVDAIEKKPDQTTPSFREDIAALLALHCGEQTKA